MWRRSKHGPVRGAKGTPDNKGEASDCEGRTQRDSQWRTTPDGFFPSGVRLKILGQMKILVQNRNTHAFLARDAKWVRHVDDARPFATSIEALRYCAERELRDTDMLVCFPGARNSIRLRLI
jgi:hypothetical protein